MNHIERQHYRDEQYEAQGVLEAWNTLLDAHNAVVYGFDTCRLPEPGKPIDVAEAEAHVASIEKEWEKEWSNQDRDQQWTGAPPFSTMGLNAKLYLHSVLSSQMPVKMFRELLSPTLLCDFDDAEIGYAAINLSAGLVTRRETFKAVYQFVKEMPYGLEDWNVKASETLRKGWGMCSGKANLLVALLRPLGIPARYRVYKIKAEARLWKWIAAQESELARLMGEPSPEQDHVAVDVYLNGWETCDPSRDSALEQGLRKLGIPLERRPLTCEDGAPRFTLLSSIDEWAENRQRMRRFRENRERLFSGMNEVFDVIRTLGKS